MVSAAGSSTAAARSSPADTVSSRLRPDPDTAAGVSRYARPVGVVSVVAAPTSSPPLPAACPLYGRLSTTRTATCRPAPLVMSLSARASCAPPARKVVYTHWSPTAGYRASAAGKRRDVTVPATGGAPVSTPPTATTCATGGTAADPKAYHTSAPASRPSADPTVTTAARGSQPKASLSPAPKSTPGAPTVAPASHSADGDMGLAASPAGTSVPVTASTASASAAPRLYPMPRSTAHARHGGVPATVTYPPPTDAATLEVYAGHPATPGSAITKWEYAAAATADAFHTASSAAAATAAGDVSQLTTDDAFRVYTPGSTVAVKTAAPAADAVSAATAPSTALVHALLSASPAPPPSACPGNSARMARTDRPPDDCSGSMYSCRRRRPASSRTTAPRSAALGGPAATPTAAAAAAARVSAAHLLPLAITTRWGMMATPAIQQQQRPACPRHNHMPRVPLSRQSPAHVL